MKANELMIGDWVFTQLEDDKQSLARVVTIGGSLYGFPSSIEVKGHDAPYYEDEVSPIPLTEDILKANGFKVKDDNVNDYILMLPSNCLFRNYIEVFKMVDGRLCVMALFHINEFKANRVKVEVSHVHELQHALRLCGLVELADNFKVE